MSTYSAAGSKSALIDVLGIGTPSIAIIAQIEGADVSSLGLDKGIMKLIALAGR